MTGSLTRVDFTMKEGATVKLRRLLIKALTNHHDATEVIERFGILPPAGLDAEALATEIVNTIEDRGIWTEVIVFRNRTSSGCSCRLFGGGRRWGAGGHHWLETDAAYWFERNVRDLMKIRDVRPSSFDGFVGTLTEDEIEAIENLSEALAGSRVRFERCPVYNGERS